MQDLIIKVENRHVKEAVVLFFDNYKDQIAVFLNNVLKNEVGAADSFITKTPEGELAVYQTAPDKGFVLAQVDGKIVFTEYKPLPLETKYVVYDGQYLSLFIKDTEDKPDIKIGRFANLNEVVSQIDSESVKTTIDTIKAGLKNAEIERKKIEKKALKFKKQLAKSND